MELAQFLRKACPLDGFSHVSQAGGHVLRDARIRSVKPKP